MEMSTPPTLFIGHGTLYLNKSGSLVPTFSEKFHGDGMEQVKELGPNGFTVI